MGRVTLDEIDLGSVEDAVGVLNYPAGYRALDDGAVRRVDWDADERGLHGVVQDRGGELHETVVYFTAGRPMMFVRSFCSCQVAYECKHAASIALAGALASGQDLTARPQSVHWEHSLASLLESRRQPGRQRPAETPIAIELTLAELGGRSGRHPAPGERELTLRARLVQPGKQGGWVAGPLTWPKLNTQLNYGAYGGAAGLGDYPEQHVRLMWEFYSAYRAGDELAGRYGYYPGRERHLDLASFESRQLWSLLDEAYSMGLPVVYGRKLGPVPAYGTAELCLDITRRDPSGPLLISPQLRVDDAAVIPLVVIGSEGNGIAYVDPAELDATSELADWRFRLARLAEPVPGGLLQMSLTGQSMRIPAADEARFREQFYPQLRHAATLISSDGSVALPAISPPTLVLGACYGDGHDLDVSWEWAYQVGDEQLRAPLGAGALAADFGPEAYALAAGANAARGSAAWASAAGASAAAAGSSRAGQTGASFRDLDAEHAILASLDVPAGRVRAAQLTGIDTMLFSTEVLPLLAGQPGVEVEISGEPADYREAGDSLRIGISTGPLSDDNDWFDLGITITVEGCEVPFADLFKALGRGDPYLMLGNGAYFSLDKPELQALARLIDEARTLLDAPAGQPLRISKFQAGLWAELAELGVVSGQAREWKRQVEGLISIDCVDTATQPPPMLTANLRPYQLQGFRWLAFLWQHQLGGILADDMGLGKTVQSLALISHARQVNPDSPPFLIVTPTSVLSNWAAEAAKFAPDLKVALISDTMAKRRSDLAGLTVGADAVVTTYTLLRLDFASYAAAEWSGLILDEAQYTKNHQSKVYQCARRLTAPFKLAITGTPMENSLMELWSLLSITAPGLFPSPDRFQDYYARPIEKHGNADLLGQLRRRIRPLVLRRTKEQVAADLPAKQEQVLEVELHPRHRKLYDTHLQRERQKVLGMIEDMSANRFTILRSLTLLRQLSLHAGLVDPAHAEMPCSKIDALLDQLGEVVAGGHRALVFSQFTRFLDLVRWRLDAAGIRYCYLDGKTRDRAAVIQRFKDGVAPVFVISLKAGGFGLNLTEADYCFLLDPWWNPATEAQAVDRAHRIGQTRNVVVYRLISAGTIEEKVMALKARKAELFSSVIDRGNVFGGGLDADDIRALFE
ncbi:MAG: DEAD/DEAH box helicase [Streptosporangiaceae bacterium]